YVSGDAGASVVNAGGIWGDVSVDSTATDILFSKVATDTNTVTTAVTLPSATTQVTTTTTVDASNGENKFTGTDSGHDATLSNTGTIGLKTNNKSGEVDIANGNVDLSANGNVTVTNAKGAFIYGSVTGDASGSIYTSDEVTTGNSTEVVTATLNIPA